MHLSLYPSIRLVLIMKNILIGLLVLASHRHVSAVSENVSSYPSGYPTGVPSKRIEFPTGLPTTIQGIAFI